MTTQEKKRAAVEKRAHRARFVPRADVIEKDGELSVITDLPGADSKSVDIALDGDLIRISTDVQEHSPGEGYTLAYSEYEAGKFERSFVLPDDIDRDGIRATVKNGVLLLTMPRVKKPGPRKIEIAAN